MLESYSKDQDTYTNSIVGSAYDWTVVDYPVVGEIMGHMSHTMTN